MRRFARAAALRWTLLALLGGSVLVLGACGAAPVSIERAATPPELQAELQERAVAEDGVIPARLRIPKLNIDATVEWVGLAANGNMADPSNAADVAWFEQGYLPGSPGNAVIAGHLDDVRNRPAVFWSLDTLVQGDIVEVVDPDGRAERFAVTGSQLYDADEAPVEEIFGPTDRRRLNLITCDGVFDEARGMYGERLVVFTELVT